MARVLLAALTVMTLCSTAFTAEIAKYIPRTETVLLKVSSHRLSIDKSVCLFDAIGEIGCGRVSATTRRSIAIRLTETSRSPITGRQVTIRSQKRSPASTKNISERFKNTDSGESLDLTGGVTTGLKYYYPMLHLQAALGRNFSLGLEPMVTSYANTNSSVLAYGGYLTGTYYHTHFAFKGVFFQGGLGAFKIKAKALSIEEEATSFGAKFNIGWRGRAIGGLGGLHLGVSAGIQYIFYEEQLLDITFEGILPMVSAFVGYSF